MITPTQISTLRRFARKHGLIVGGDDSGFKRLIQNFAGIQDPAQLSEDGYVIMFDVVRAYELLITLQMKKGLKI